MNESELLKKVFEFKCDVGSFWNPLVAFMEIMLIIDNDALCSYITARAEKFAKSNGKRQK